MPDAELARPSDPSPSRATVDVAIIGAGLTGLWTAWYLLQSDPGLRVVVFERETIGFGASGRNGGWCSALLPMSLTKISERHGESAAHRMMQAMHDTVGEVGRFVDQHGAPEIFHSGGTITVARNLAQRHRLRDELDELRRFGFGDDDYRWLDGDEAKSVINATGVIAGLRTPHCAAVHPLRLTHALARAVIAAGGEIREHTEVTEIHPGRLVTDDGDVAADVIVRATEGYTPQLAGERRSLLPIYSLMIATEPLPDSVWAEIGLADRPTFADGRHLIIYGQRTADGRFAFGGRGAPYHFGSTIRPEFDTDDAIRALLESSLRELFPQIGDVAITHHWGGVLAAPRRLDLLGAVRSLDRPGERRRLRRRRRQHDQPRRAHARGVDHRRRRSRGVDTAAVGRPSLAEVGARTAPVDRRQRWTRSSTPRRSRRAPDRQAERRVGRIDRPAAAALTR